MVLQAQVILIPGHPVTLLVLRSCTLSLLRRDLPLTKTVHSGLSQNY